MDGGYSAMFLYNKAIQGLKRYQNRDQVLSLEVVKFAVKKLAAWDLPNCYYHGRDATPEMTYLKNFLKL